MLRGVRCVVVSKKRQSQPQFPITTVSEMAERAEGDGVGASTRSNNKIVKVINARIPFGCIMCK